jgi:hypothetical protein
MVVLGVEVDYVAVAVLFYAEGNVATPLLPDGVKDAHEAVLVLHPNGLFVCHGMSRSNDRERVKKNRKLFFRQTETLWVVAYAGDYQVLGLCQE